MLGQIILSVGFGLLLNPDLWALPAYAALGAFVGVLRLVADRWATLSVALPVIASFLVTVIAVKLVAPFVHDDPIRLVAPALITFLPGATLTIATIELASDQIVSGASRLVWGVSQLLLLAFGVFVGLSLVGTVDATGARQVGLWAPWVGVALVGVGYLLFTSAPPGSLLFLWVALFASYAAQTLGATLLDPALSGFVGGLVIVPLTHALARLRRAPPAAVMLLPGFWLLLPGALGFRGVSGLATGAVGGAADLVVTGISIFAVALGVLSAQSVTRDARAVQQDLADQVPAVDRSAITAAMTDSSAQPPVIARIFPFGAGLGRVEVSTTPSVTSNAARTAVATRRWVRVRARASAPPLTTSRAPISRDTRRSRAAITGWAGVISVCRASRSGLTSSRTL